MGESFSERYGYDKTPEDHFIYEDAPEQLREYIKKVFYGDMRLKPITFRSFICNTLLVRADPQCWGSPFIESEIDDHLHSAEWYQVYDLIENIAQHYNGSQFEELMNEGFVKLGIGWKLIDGKIELRTEESIETTLKIAKTTLKECGFKNAHKELKEAIEDLSKRPEPDLTGCVQHAMAALESVAREITGDHKKTLGDIIKLHPDILPKPLDDSLTKMWGYSCEFARHIREDRIIARQEALLILGISSTIITYLIESVGE